MKKRISGPRAATVVVIAVVAATAATVAPSLAAKAQSFLTTQKAAKTYVTNQKAAKTYLSQRRAAKTYLTNKAVSSTYLKSKTASNLYVAKATAPLEPVNAISAGTTPFTIASTTPGYVPTAFTSFATKATASTATIVFSGTANCTTLGKEATSDQACPVSILVDGQSTGKVNFAPATLKPAKGAAPLVHTIMQTTVLGKGGHTIQIQYAGASGVQFSLNTWNLSVQAFPEPIEVPETTPPPSTK